MDRLAAIILNYNDYETTVRLLKSIETYSIIQRIVVVDNCSIDDSYEQLLKYKSAKIDVIKSEKNGGYGYGNNYGISYLNHVDKPTHILICNPDITIDEIVIEKMLLSFHTRERVAVVAPFMINRDGRKEPGTAWRIPSKSEYICSAGVILNHLFKFNRYVELEHIKKLDEMEVDCVAGSLLMVDNNVMLKYGMYDENIFLFGEETTLGCKFKRSGYKSILLLQDGFLHLHGASINKSISSEIKKHKLMLRSRLYILRHYLDANDIDLIFARLFYAISTVEYRLILILRGIKKKINAFKYKS